MEEYMADGQIEKTPYLSYLDERVQELLLALQSTKKVTPNRIVQRRFYQKGTKDKGTTPYIRRREHHHRRGRESPIVDEYPKPVESQEDHERKWRLLKEAFSKIKPVDGYHEFNSKKRRDESYGQYVNHCKNSLTANLSELKKAYDEISNSPEWRNEDFRAEFTQKVVKTLGLGQLSDFMLYAQMHEAINLGNQDYEKIIKSGEKERRVRIGGWNPRVRKAISGYLVGKVPEGTENIVQIVENGRCVEHYHLGKGFVLGEGEIPLKADGELRMFFRDSGGVYGIQFSIRGGTFFNNLYMDVVKPAHYPVKF